MNFREGPSVQEPGFQIAPMIDVVFILLSFFVATQLFSQWETEIDVKLPTAQEAQVPSRLPGEVIINILRDGTVRINQRALEQTELSALLHRIVEVFPGQPVLIRADRATAYENVIRVLDLCRQADIWNISFATAPVEDAAPDGTS